MPRENSRYDVAYHDILMTDRELKIVPIGDIHFNAPMFAKDVFNEWCQKYKREKNCWFIGLGDYLETFSGSERKATAQLHASCKGWQDEKVTDDVNALAKRLEFTKGRWLGMLSGNHNHITDDGYTVTQMLAQRLNAQALGVCASIRLYLMRNTKSKAVIAYDIWAHHGRDVELTSTMGGRDRW